MASPAASHQPGHMAIPLIDLSPLPQSPPDAEAVQRLAAEVDRACRQVGFLYVSGHGVSEEEMQGLVGLTRRLFDLPQAAKDGLDASKSALARGYNSQELGKHSCTPEDGRQDVKESFTLGVERAAGDPRPPSPMHGPNQWPPEALLPGWRAEAEAAFSRLLGVARLMMRALALALRQPEAFFTDKCNDPVAQLVLFRYPPTGGGDAERGCGAHTDCGFLTFVCQDAPGIEVQLADGSWFAAPSLPGTFLVNLGDLAQRWTGDVYRSTMHRVVNRSSSETRHSAVFFCNCNFDALVETIVPAGSGGGTGGCAGNGSGDDRNTEGGAGGPHMYPPVTAGKYILEKLGLMWD
ncbi:hypothetical protein COHA_003057 [Chlorella ohadii]|uniref:Fe2OG dioxygenase domain-containing protein n=1 Tax=Chlorella ohadii TaxID=2649997 RepID=A0AAD5DW50_9CHLO|nr:hypothetical protein COHA_003057 [Chlorella ohadii]